MAKLKFPSGKDITHKAVPVVGGALGAKIVKNVGKKFMTSPTLQKFVPALPLVVGLFLSQQKGFMEYAGLGMMAVGGADLAAQFVPSLAGLEDMDLSGVFAENQMSGPLNDDSDMNGPLDGPLNAADDDYGADY